jgi:uncharacterized protein (TIGR04255 family)
MALETVHTAAELQLHERIGLRYVDLIEPGVGEGRQDYLASHLLGYDATLVGVSESSFSFQFEGQTPYGRLVARHYIPQIANMFPPDLAGISLNYAYREPPFPGRVSLLDFDHASVYKGDFVVDEILATLENLHDGLDIFFRNSVTDYALKKWGSNDVTSSDN